MNEEPVFVPYDLPIENIETKGNYKKTDLYGIQCYNVPPYSLLVDKDNVPEVNLDSPDKDKLFYMEFNIENTDKK